MGTIDRFWEDESCEYKNPVIETTANRLVEEFELLTPFNPMEISEGLWKEFPEFEELKGTITGAEDDEITSIQKIWRTIEKLQIIFKENEDGSFSKNTIKTYDKVLKQSNLGKLIEEIEQLNNPHYENFLSTENAKLKKMESSINLYMTKSFGPML